MLRGCCPLDLTAGALVSFPGNEAAASIGKPVNREAQIATMLIIGFGVAFFGWISRALRICADSEG